MPPDCRRYTLRRGIEAASAVNDSINVRSGVERHSGQLCSPAPHEGGTWRSHNYASLHIKLQNG
jgi:hypothetical protein